MCGRIAQKIPLDEVRVLFETVNPIPNTAATYNGAPTGRLTIVRLGRIAAARSICCSGG